jgi:Abortive infection alpha
VRAGKALGLGSEMVAPGLNMIGAEAGCRYLDRVPAYLNNLYRLGLIWFSREPLEDPLDYQVLEAQPDVIEAKRAGGRAKTVRRSISLTPFGEDFCRICLPLA